MADDRFNELLEAYIEGEISEEKLQELHEIVHGSKDSRHKFQQATRLHVLLRETLTEQVELQSIQDGVALAPMRDSRWNSYPIAAAAVILLATGLAFYLNRERSASFQSQGVCLNISGSNELYFERGSKRYPVQPDFQLQIGDAVQCGDHTQAMLRLSDGSILSMEPRSRISLVSEQPEIVLEHGEVHFEIAKRNADMPSFQVRTPQSTIDVMGTVFTLSGDGQTDLKVYEGRVALTRHRDNATVEVGSQQMTTTAAENLSVSGLPQPSQKSVSILPTDDATLDLDERDATGIHLKVEGKRRVIYLRFAVPDVKGIQSAKLRLTQDIDAGSGTLRFFVGDHHSWSESNLTRKSAPNQLAEVAQHRGVVRRGQTLEVDIKDAIEETGPVTIIVTLDKANENDIWFSSREGDHPPQLILNYQQ